MPSAARDLFIVRHGTTDWNEVGRVMGRSAIELNARGRAEAEALAEALSEFSFGAVIASPTYRAQQTAEAIAQRHGLSVRTDADLDEVWVTRWQGKRWQDLRDDPDLQCYFTDATHVCDAFEAAVAVQRRAVAAAERALGDPGDSAIVLVSHGDPIRVLLAHYLGMDLAAYRRLVVSTGSLSVFRFGAAVDRRLLVLNWKPPGTLRELLA